MDVEEPTGTPQAEGAEGISIKEAAVRLGISEKALRGRIKRGTVDAYEIDTKFGKQWLVRLPADAGVGEESMGTPHEVGAEPSSGESTEARPTRTSTEDEQSMGTPRAAVWEAEREQLLARLADKDGEVMRLVTQLDQRAAEAERWQLILLDQARRMAALEEDNRRLLALPAIIQAAEDAETDHGETASDPPAEEAHTPKRKGWFSRLFGG